MKKKARSLITVLLALVLAVAILPGGAVPASAAEGYTPPYSKVRIGIYTYKSDGNIDQRSFPSANLQYADGMGTGYELGYFDENRVFVSLGAFITDTAKITAMMDRNMVYSAASRSYSVLEGNASGVTVGCFHLKLNAVFDNYADAKAAADSLDRGFVRYENDTFRVLFGQYYSTPEVQAAAVASELDVTPDSGTSHTVTIVETGTDRILFEFDCGTAKSLAVHTLAPEGVKAQTWHRDDRYYGDFAFLRNTGGNLTTVNYVDVEDYVKGVVCYEMSPTWPVEALKAQAICARTFLMANINKHRSLGFDICNTIDCQAYHGTESANANSDRAVDETAGQYLMYEGELCETYYFSSDGGATEDVGNVWTEKHPYLTGVVDPYEKDIENTAYQYFWTVTYTPATLGQRLRDLGRSCSDIVRIDLVFTEMGNVKSITFVDRDGRSFTADKEKARTYPRCRSPRYTVNGLTIAESSEIYVNDGATVGDSTEGLAVLGSDGLGQLPSGDVYAITGEGEIDTLGVGKVSYSGSVSVNAQGKFVFSGSGYGHNVGMSQWGAYSMAKFYGKTCREILTFYYNGTEIVTAETPAVTASGPVTDPVLPPEDPEPTGDEPTGDGTPGEEPTEDGEDTGGDTAPEPDGGEVQ